MKTYNPFIHISWIGIIIFSLISCGKKEAGIRTVNQSSSVTISNSAIGLQNYSAFSLGAVEVQSLTPPNIKLCIKRVKLEDEEGNTVIKAGSETQSSEDDRTEHEKESGELVFAPGLIDLSTGNAVDWGTMDMPVGFKLSKIVIKAHKDRGLCGVDYSVSYNGVTTEEEIELKWKFNPGLELNEATSALRLSLDSFIAAVKGVSGLNSEKLKQSIESVEAANGEAE